MYTKPYYSSIRFDMSRSAVEKSKSEQGLWRPVNPHVQGSMTLPGAASDSKKSLAFQCEEV